MIRKFSKGLKQSVWTKMFFQSRRLPYEKCFQVCFPIWLVFLLLKKKKMKSYFIAQYRWLKLFQCKPVVNSYLIVIGTSIPLLTDWLRDTVRMFWEFPQPNRTVGLPSTRYKWRNCSPKFLSPALETKMEIVTLPKV